MGVALKIDEYVPKNIPISNVKVKFFVATGPTKNTTSIASKVVRDVFIDLTNVCEILEPTISSNVLGFLIPLLFLLYS